jgi:hypothetical protein
MLSIFYYPINRKKQRAKGKGQRAKGREQRAESRGQRAESKEDLKLKVMAIKYFISLFIMHLGENFRVLRRRFGFVAWDIAHTPLAARLILLNAKMSGVSGTETNILLIAHYPYFLYTIPLIPPYTPLYPLSPFSDFFV